MNTKEDGRGAAQKSKEKWAMAGSWAITLFVLQRVYADGMHRTKRLASMIGDPGLVQPVDEKLLAPMACIQAFAIEQLLKSLAMRGGKTPKETHDLKALYDGLGRGCTRWPKVQQCCQKEYHEWRKVALELVREQPEGMGAGLRIEPNLGRLLDKHKHDFVRMRYIEELPKEEARPGRDRLAMFLCLCALEALRFQKIIDDDYDKQTRYSITGSGETEGSMLRTRGKSLINCYLADGGQDLSVARQKIPW